MRRYEHARLVFANPKFPVTMEFADKRPSVKLPPADEVPDLIQRLGQEGWQTIHVIPPKDIFHYPNYEIWLQREVILSKVDEGLLTDRLRDIPKVALHILDLAYRSGYKPAPSPEFEILTNHRFLTLEGEITEKAQRLFEDLEKVGYRISQAGIVEAVR